MAYKRKTSSAASSYKSGNRSSGPRTAARGARTGAKSSNAKPATRRVKAKPTEQVIRIELVSAPENGVSRPLVGRIIQPRKAQF